MKKETTDSGQVDLRVRRFKCLLCGRKAFTKTYTPHKCFNGQLIKHFGKLAKIRGLKTVWIEV